MRDATDSFCHVPALYRAEIVLGTRRQLHPEFETEQAIDVLHEIEQRLDLGSDLRPRRQPKDASSSHASHAHLRRHTKYVCVILHETPDAGQTCQRTRGFIPVHDTKFGHPDRQFFVTPVPGVKDEAVTGAIHRLESPRLLLDVDYEHVVLVVLPVPRGLPQL
jgi:hypothetical protein